MKDETALRRWAIKELKRRGYTVISLVGSAVQKSGLPDTMSFGNGRTIFIEFKNPNDTGRTSKLQKYMCKLINDNGSESYIVKSKDEIKNILNK